MDPEAVGGRKPEGCLERDDTEGDGVQADHATEPIELRGHHGGRAQLCAQCGLPHDDVVPLTRPIQDFLPPNTGAHGIVDITRRLMESYVGVENVAGIVGGLEDADDHGVLPCTLDG